jgi:hypothetical protein
MILLATVPEIFGAIRYLSRSEHLRRSPGTDQFSPSDPFKTRCPNAC